MIKVLIIYVNFEMHASPTTYAHESLLLNEKSELNMSSYNHILIDKRDEEPPTFDMIIHS